MRAARGQRDDRLTNTKRGIEAAAEAERRVEAHQQRPAVGELAFAQARSWVPEQGSSPAVSNAPARSGQGVM
jgi:hypothetical protein